MDVKDERKKRMMTSYTTSIFKNTKILSANSPAVADMQIDSHFDLRVSTQI